MRRDLTRSCLSQVDGPVLLPCRTGSATPNNPGFPFVNLVAGAVSVTTIIAVMLLAKGIIRRCAILIGLLIGTLCYTVFVPVSFEALIAAPLLVTSKPFPFGFDVQFELVVALLPASMGSMALYQTVADWCPEHDAHHSAHVAM